jgi:hypothetical protein
MKTYETYIYLDPRNPGKWFSTFCSFLFEPIYVGEGKPGRKLDHLKDTKPSHKTNRISEIIADGFYPFIITLNTEILLKSESVDQETKLILDLGTRAIIEGVKRGPLTNLRLYGKRSSLSEETKLKMSLSKRGKSFSDEHRLKLSIASKGVKRGKKSQRGAPLSDTHKSKISLRQKGREKSDNEKANISAAQKGKLISTDHRAKISASCKGRESPNRRRWILAYETGKQEIIFNLRLWCKENSIPYTSLINTRNYDTFYRGMKIISKANQETTIC